MQCSGSSRPCARSYRCTTTLWPYDETSTRGIDSAEARIVSLNCEKFGAFEANRHCAVLDLDVFRLACRTVKMVD